MPNAEAAELLRGRARFLATASRLWEAFLGWPSVGQEDLGCKGIGGWSVTSRREKVVMSDAATFQIPAGLRRFVA